MMQRDDCNYTFVISFSKRNRICVRPLRISKRLINSCLGVAIFTTGICSVFTFQTDLPNNPTAEFSKKYFAASSLQNFDDLVFRRSVHVNGEGGPEAVEQNFAADNDEIEELTDEPVLANLNTDADYTPSIYPLAGKINNEFGWRRNPFGSAAYERHSGMDIDGNRGDTVIAPAGGVVIKSGWQGGYGNLIEIDHGSGVTTRYGHLSNMAVENGAEVVRGMEIGKVGSTGRSTGPHLHYEVRINGQAVNPRRYLPSKTETAE